MYKNCKFLKQNSTYKKKQNRYNFLYNIFKGYTNDKCRKKI